MGVLEKYALQEYIYFLNKIEEILEYIK